MTQQEYLNWLMQMGFAPDQAQLAVASAPPGVVAQLNPSAPLGSTITPKAAASQPSMNLATASPGASPAVGGSGSEIPAGVGQGLQLAGTAASLAFPPAAPFIFGGEALFSLLGGLGAFDSGLPKTAKTSAVASGLQGSPDELSRLVGQYMGQGAAAGNPLSNPAFGSSVEQVASMLEALTNQQINPITINSFQHPVSWSASPVANVEKLLKLPQGMQPLSDPSAIQAAFQQISSSIPYGSPLSGPNFLKDFNQIVQRLQSSGVVGQNGNLPANTPTSNVAAQLAGEGGALGPILSQYLTSQAGADPTFGSLQGSTGNIATLLENLTGQTLGPLSFTNAGGQTSPLKLGDQPGGGGFALPQGYGFLGTDANSLMAALNAITGIISPTGGGAPSQAQWQQVLSQLMGQGLLTRPGQAGNASAGTMASGATTTVGLPHPLTNQPTTPLPYPVYNVM